MTTDELKVLITADTSGLQKGMSKGQSALTGFKNAATGVSKNLLGTIVTGNLVGTAISKTFGVITQSIGNAVSRLDTLNNYPNVMGNLGIGSEDSSASIKVLSDKLQGLPTSLDSASMAVQRFTSANGNIKASTEMFLSLNNAILAGGAPMQIQASALEQMSQAYAKGKPDMMEWRALMSAMPAQLTQMATAMGYANADKLGESLRNGTVSMNEFMLKMIELNHNGANGFQSFEAQARNSTNGVATSIANVKTAITRGLAEIMNAIGQANIAGFFQTIAKVINAVIPYITAFVKVCGWAIGAISSLFGGKSSVSQSVNNVSSSLGNLGSTASSASSPVSNLGKSGSSATKGLTNATKATKKLNKELLGLAGFDNVNVLNKASEIPEPTDGSSSGGSGGGGSGDVGGLPNLGDLGNIDFSGFDSSLGNTTALVDELFEKMKAGLEWFTSDMDFQPLMDSFSNLGGAIQQWYNGASDCLGRFMQYYLKPLATFVVNEALPNFLNTTAKAISGIDFSKINNSFEKLFKALEPFTEAIFKGLLWGYDKVIVPIFHVVTNNILPGFLDLLAGVVKIVTKALEDAAPILGWFIEKIVVPIAEFAGSIIGDVLSGIGDALGWIADNEIAMSILEGVGIALGIVAGGATAANIAVGIWNGICGIASAVTTLLGVAFNILCSPITLVVLAIGAVIAAVILLIKNWDTVKEVAANVWNAICEFFSGIGQWLGDRFNEAVEFIKNVFGAIGEFFQGVWDSICNIFSGVGQWFMDRFTEAIDNIQNVFGVIGEFFKGVWDGICQIFSVVGQWFMDRFNDAVNGIKSIFDTVVDIASNVWDGICNVFSVLGNWFSDLFNNAVNAIKSIWDGLINIASNIWNGICNVFSVIVNWFSNIFNNTVNGIRNIWNGLINIAGNIWNGICNIFSGVGSFFSNIFSSAVNAIRNIFNPIVSFFGNIWNSIIGMFGSVGATIGNVVSGAFKGVVNGILGAVEGILNAPINAVNGLIGLINNIPGVNLPRLNTFNLPRLAQGGFFTRETPVVVGEAGPEAVMPLKNQPKVNKMIADNIMSEMELPENSRLIEYVASIEEYIRRIVNEKMNDSSPINLNVKLGEEALIDKVIEGINKKSFETNREVLFI